MGGCRRWASEGGAVAGGAHWSVMRAIWPRAEPAGAGAVRCRFAPAACDIVYYKVDDTPRSFWLPAVHVYRLQSRSVQSTVAPTRAKTAVRQKEIANQKTLKF